LGRFRDLSTGCYGIPLRDEISDAGAEIAWGLTGFEGIRRKNRQREIDFIAPCDCVDGSGVFLLRNHTAHTNGPGGIVPIGIGAEKLVQFRLPSTVEP
jgi:hypothetical protein